MFLTKFFSIVWLIALILGAIIASKDILIGMVILAVMNIGLAIWYDFWFWSSDAFSMRMPGTKDVYLHYKNPHDSDQL